MHDVFISYSRKDQVFARRIFEALSSEQLDSWADWDDIPYSAEWWQQILRGIEAANNFICVLSPAYITSKICNDELAYARQIGKRIIPVVRREFMDGGQFQSDIRAELFGKNWLSTLEANTESVGKLNYIFFRKKKGYECEFDEITRKILNPECDGIESDADDFSTAFASLLTTIQQDPQHTAQHTRLLVRAQEWELANRRNDKLLRGKEIQEAQNWLTGWQQDAQSRAAEVPPRAAKQPAPSELHIRYIQKSVAQQRRSLIVGSAVVMIAVAAVLVLFVWQNSSNERTVGSQRTLAAINLTDSAATRDFIAQATLTNIAEQRNSTAQFLSTQQTQAAISLTHSAGTREYIAQATLTSIAEQRNSTAQTVNIQQTQAAISGTQSMATREFSSQATLTSIAERKDENIEATNAAIALVIGDGLAEQIFVVTADTAPVYQEPQENAYVLTSLILYSEITLAEPFDEARPKVGREGEWIKINVPANEGLIGYVPAQLIGVQTQLTDRGFDAYVGTLPRINPPSGYYAFRANQDALGLPDPFDYLPVRLSNQTELANVRVNGFGPNSFAFRNWPNWYRRIGGLHNGLDIIVPIGTPILSLCDGIIIKNWPFIANPEDKSLIIWCFLPENMVDEQGRREMSSVLVAYSNLENNTLFNDHDRIDAGQVIGSSGAPAGQISNAHLHMEIHMLIGDPSLPNERERESPLLHELDRPQPMDNNTPWNPALFFSARIINLMQNQLSELGFNSGPSYPSNETLLEGGITHLKDLGVFSVGYFRYGCAIFWMPNYEASGCYASVADLASKLPTFPTWTPYPIDFLDAAPG
jgi:murein DD-endopeptidase MepM/ murein hydrolase activator NlpD